MPFKNEIINFASITKRHRPNGSSNKVFVLVVGLCLCLCLCLVFPQRSEGKEFQKAKLSSREGFISAL